LIDGEKTFLIPVKAGQQEWNLIEIEGVDKLPAVQWKLTSVQRMSVKTTEGAFGKAKASTLRFSKDERKVFQHNQDTRPDP